VPVPGPPLTLSGAAQGQRGTSRALAAALLVAALLLGLLAPAASAHPISTSAVLLDVGERAVTAEVELPVDRLAVAFDQPYTAADVLEPTTLAVLRDYLREHLSATEDDGGAWTTTVENGRVASIDGVDHLVLDATLTPAGGTVGDFTLHDDAILDRIVSHKIFVSARQGSTGSYTSLAMLSWQQQSVPVRKTGIDAETGFLASLQLGVHHIGSGSDHLLFLLMLLLPAPALALRRRWVPRDDLRRASTRVVHVVTAFAIGHSATLALGATGLLHLPTRLVESGIALSVLVSAVHAVRPLVREGEVLIAGTFGLLHGLAFAALVDQLGLGRQDLVVDLLGFNVGIEVAQLAVVALVMPSLWVLSRTRAYTPARNAAAGLGVLLSAGWLAGRSGLTTRNPLEPLSDQVVDHPLLLAAALALGAGLARLLTSPTAEPSPTGTSTAPPRQHLPHSTRASRGGGDQSAATAPTPTPAPTA